MTVLTLLTFSFILMGQSAQAEWGVSFQGGVGSSNYAYYGDRITSDYRRGYQADDWVERGSSSVTESPVYSDGVRLTAWSTKYEDDYDYAIASAIYFFEIPSRARSVRIKISYEGEADRDYLDDGIIGRVWVRRSRISDDYEEYYPREGRYEDVDEPLYGDTYVLRARKRFEIIRMSADDHTIDDMMELHVVAEGRQRVDVKYIEVETYSSLPSVRVITRYYGDYQWKPWSDYTYWYFYTGPVFHFSDYYYVRYTYPRYHNHYIDIRRNYNNYLQVYYKKRPGRHVRWVNVARVSKGTRRNWERGKLNRWTSSHEDTRRGYRVMTSSRSVRSVDVQKSRTRIKSTLSSHTRSSPATVRARTGSSSTRTVVTPSSRQRSTSIQTPSSRANQPRARQVERNTSTPSSRTAPSRSRSSVNSSPSVETRSRTSSTRTRSNDTRSSTRTQQSPSVQSDRSRSSRDSSSSTRSSTQRSRGTTPSSSRSQIKRESDSTSRSSTSNRSSSVKRSTPSKSRSTQKAPPKKIEVKKKDDDDEDEDKKKSSSVIKKSSSSSRSGSSSSSSKSSSSSTRRRSVTR